MNEYEALLKQLGRKTEVTIEKTDQFGFSHPKSHMKESGIKSAGRSA
jgi:hypothetical protein